jgi:hypothetical protein
MMEGPWEVYKTVTTLTMTTVFSSSNNCHSIQTAKESKSLFSPTSSHSFNSFDQTTITRKIFPNTTQIFKMRSTIFATVFLAATALALPLECELHGTPTRDHPH